MPQAVPVIAAVIAGGAQAYSANQQSKAAKSAANAQADAAKYAADQPTKIQAAAEAEAKAKLKLKQASQTKTILTNPLGDEADTNSRSILGV
jgi:hypothetical protein